MGLKWDKIGTLLHLFAISSNEHPEKRNKTEDCSIKASSDVQKKNPSIKTLTKNIKAAVFEEDELECPDKSKLNHFCHYWPNKPPSPM